MFFGLSSSFYKGAYLKNLQVCKFLGNVMEQNETLSAATRFEEASIKIAEANL
jgi:hypothetical protein